MTMAYRTGVTFIAKLEVAIYALLPGDWIACHVDRCNDRNVILTMYEEHRVRKSPQERSSRIVPYALELQWFTFDIGNATRDLGEEALAKASLLRFVPGVAFGNVRLRLRSDDQPHVRLA